MGALVDDRFLDVFRGKRIFVTGHTGFKGSWLTFLLTQLGAEVQGYALAPEYSGSHFERLNLARKIRHIEGDIRDAVKLSSTLKAFQPEIVFHLAAQALVRQSYTDPKVTYDTNVGGSVNLLEAIRACEAVRSLVFVTSDKCYENVEWIWGYRETDRLGGHDPYSASKAAAEIVFSSYARSFFAQRSQLGAASVRAGNVIGGGDWAADRIVPDCVRALQAGQAIQLRNPAATRPWQHVLEPISGYMLLAAKLYEEPATYQGAWNFGPPIGDVHTVADVAQCIAADFNQGTIAIGEQNRQQHEAQLLQLNSDKARQLLGWRTRWDFEQTMAATIGWYRQVLIEKQDASVVTGRQLNEFFRGLS